MLCSLEALSTSHVNSGGPRVCCAVTPEWYHYVHTRCQRSSLDDFGELSAFLTNKLESQNDSARARTSCMIPEVEQLANKAVLGDTKGFPGPMCSPLCRKHTNTIRDRPYTFTEKSDGLRVIVVSVVSPCFPRWTVITSTESDDATVANYVLHLDDVAALEAARTQLSQQDNRESKHSSRDTAAASAPVHISGIAYRLFFSAEADSSSSVFTLQQETSGRDIVTEVTLHRSVMPRHMHYALDRTMDAAYVLLEDWTLASALDYFVVDGELMEVYAENVDGTSPKLNGQLAFGLFDLYCYETGGTAAGTVHLSRETMTSRYAHLRQFFDSFQPPAAHVLSYERRVWWHVKQMRPVSEMYLCLQQLLLEASDRRYFYRGLYGLTRNDGFIFTPDDFPICSGASATQLKWKWRSLLSVDWLVRKDCKSNGSYEASLFFHKKNYNFRNDSVGHWKLLWCPTLENPHNFEIPSSAPGVVVECCFDDSRGVWVMERLRSDKTGANSIVTALSVLESLAENISLRNLSSLLGLTDAIASDLVDTLDPPPTTPSMALSDIIKHGKFPRPPPNTAKFTLRAISKGGEDGTVRLSLNWCTNNGNAEYKNAIPCAMCEVRECAGFGQSPMPCSSTSSSVCASCPLEDYLCIQLANAGGCYAWSDFVVEAFFDGAKGNWEIVKLHPLDKRKNFTTAFDNVVQHLSWLLALGGGDACRNYATRGPKPSPLLFPTPVIADTIETNRHYGEKVREFGACGTVGKAAHSNLRLFNNWAKSYLIKSQCSEKQRILDICCGRGGDLHKWKAVQPLFVFMTDASPECVAEAARRYCTQEGLSTKVPPNRQHKGFPAYFAVHDAFDPTTSALREEIQSATNGQPIDFVSCQFSMHYGCASQERIECFVSTVAKCLRLGGHFVGTTVSDAVLYERFIADGSSFGSSAYHISFTEDSANILKSVATIRDIPYGVKYFATVEKSVSELPEYVVPWAAFTHLCEQHGLRLIQDAALDKYYEDNKDGELGQEIIRAVLRKRDRDDTLFLSISDDEREAIQVYRLFVFEKVSA